MFLLNKKIRTQVRRNFRYNTPYTGMIQQVQRVKGLIRLTLSCAAAPPALHLWFVLQAVSAALDWIISPYAAKCKA